MGWFRFKGKDSKDYGILISSAPQRVRPARRVEEITIPGRSGTLTKDEGTHDAYMLQMECSTRGTDHIEEIVEWLTGRGELILSTEPDKIYVASIYNKISFSDMIYLYNSFLLQFKVQPYKYSAYPEGDLLELTAPTSIVNHGTVSSQPIITVYGSGDISLTVGNLEITLTDVEESITIDSEMQEVFKGTDSQNSKYGAVDFPALEIGENLISWAGNVEKVEIIPKWRWL